MIDYIDFLLLFFWVVIEFVRVVILVVIIIPNIS